MCGGGDQVENRLKVSPDLHGEVESLGDREADEFGVKQDRDADPDDEEERGAVEVRVGQLADAGPEPTVVVIPVRARVRACLRVCVCA